MNSIQKGLRQLLSPVGRPTAEAVKASAIAILASFPTPPQNQSIFYGSQHSLGEVFCYFYKSNDLCFLTGSKRKRPCRGQRESPLFSSSTKKFTPCNQNGRLSAKKRPVVGANRAPIFASNAKKVLPINDQKMQREQPPHFPSFMVYDLHAQIILLDF